MKLKNRQTETITHPESVLLFPVFLWNEVQQALNLVFVAAAGTRPGSLQNKTWYLIFIWHHLNDS